MADEGNGGDNGPDGPDSWVDRHLGKILVLAALICAMALMGRALTG